MSYIVPSDFRTGTVAEYCRGLELSETEVSSAGSEALLTAAIARLSARVDELTNDHFAAETLTLDLSTTGGAQVFLPRRTTALTAVSTRDYNGTLTLQSASAYRLAPSLDAAGAVAIRDFDVLSVVPGKYLAGSFYPWSGSSVVWPYGPNAMQVAGTFGWTVTPADIKRAVALMVWHSLKPMGDLLRVSDQMNTADAQYQLVPVPPEAQGIIDRYTRKRVPF